MKTLLVTLFLFSVQVMASGHAEAEKHNPSQATGKPREVLPPQQQPENCLKNKVYPCAVWAIGKGHILHQGTDLFFSAGSLFEWKTENRVYLSSGWLWVKNKAGFTVQGRFGQVSAEHQNEMWVHAADEAFTVRAGEKFLSVRPLGGQEEMSLAQGYEIRFSFVDRNFGIADFTWPSVMDFSSYLIGIQKTAGEEQARQKAEKLAPAIVAAAQSSAQSQELALSRSLASTSKGPKVGEEEDPGRDLRLRRLFRVKSDFEE